MMPRQGRDMDAGYPLYFTLHRNWFVMTMTTELRLEEVLKRALKQTNLPEAR